MSLSETYISRKQLIADNLNTMGESTADVTDGLTTLAGKILDIPNKQSTTLTISVPLNLEYGDDFNITGTLTSAGDGVSNATIKLKVGNTVVDSDTTGGTGEVSFTQCPVRTGNHSFQLVFEGDLNHASSESTVVTRDVEKETSVITLDYPLAGSNHYSDEDIIVSGVLTDNDNTPMANKSIIVKDGNAQLLTLTTESDGSFSDTINLNAGSHTVNVVYNGDENYTQSSVSRNVTIVAVTLTLSGTKNILSYADRSSGNEKCSFTAQFNAADCSGKTVSFDIVDGQGDVVANIGTGVTNSAGLAACDNDYVTQGVGDIQVRAKCGSFVSEIFSIQDCSYYNDGSSVGSLEIGSGAICTSNGSYITLTSNTSGEKDVKLPVNLTGNWEFTTEVAELGTNQDITFKVGSGSQWGAADHTVNRITVNLGNGSNYYTKTISKDDTLKVTYVNGVMSVYWNDEYLTSRTVSISGKMGYYQVSGRTYHIKNIKLKPL